MQRDMKPDTPEWKKEIAEKVKAYGERKKRLITPPGPMKENVETPFIEPEEPVLPAYPKPQDPVIEQREASVPEPHVREAKPAHPHVREPVQHPLLEVWTGDLEGGSGFEEMTASIPDEPSAAAGPYTARRIVAGIIDHTILVVLLFVFLGAFSIWTGELIEDQMISPWKVTLPAFLFFHFLYYLYFFRATRQTPGMVFLSLELRDPGSSVIPIGKLLARWISMVAMNLFNFLPVLIGKRFLLMDLISATEMRSFK